MKENYDVAVIGGGASGLLCAGKLAEGKYSVVLLEKNNRVGKKLSATGNGRCNFTNLHMSEACYYGDRRWLKGILERYSPHDIVEEFERIGVYHRQKDGYVYPYTNQAATVVAALQRYCEKSGVTIVTECKVENSKTVEAGENRRGMRYLLHTSKGVFGCRYLILATGGQAGKEQGGDKSGYLLAKSLGHTVQGIYAGLTGLHCKGKFWPKVAGTRIQGRFSLICEEQRIEGECGEIQIVKDGVSGIPVFQLCRIAAAELTEGRNVRAEIDFVPPMSLQEVENWILIHGISGLVPVKWEPIFRDRKNPARDLKQFNLTVTDTFGIERAQVSAGGVKTDEVDPVTMESKLRTGLFLLGELLDIDGKCGGYNLHFAWCSALAASRALTEQRNS